MPKPTSLDPNKQLMIKTKTLQRLIKEASYYIQETKDNEAKLAQMKADGKDEYDIKKFAEVLEESQMMIPDSENRKNNAINDLKSFMDENDSLHQEGEWFVTAKGLLEQHS